MISVQLAIEFEFVLYFCDQKITLLLFNRIITIGPTTMWFHRSDWNRISCWNDYKIKNRSLPNKCSSLFNVQLLFSIIGQQTQSSLFSLPFSLILFSSAPLSLNYRNYLQSSSMLKNIIIVLALFNLTTIFSTTTTVHAVHNSPNFIQVNF